MRLIVVNDANRLHVFGLEQVRDLFDRNEIGVWCRSACRRWRSASPAILSSIPRSASSMPSVGFVHALRPLRGDEICHLPATHGPRWSARPPMGITDPEAIAAIIHATSGKFRFRLLHRPLSVIRILPVKGLTKVMAAVVGDALGYSGGGDCGSASDCSVLLLS